MATGTYFNTAFSTNGINFSLGGVQRLALIPRDLFTYTATLDSYGNPIEVLTITPKTALDKFVEVKFVEQSASYTDEFTKTANRYYKQTVNFTVDAIGADAIEKAHQINLGGPYAALILNAKNEWKIVGLNGLGLTSTAGTSNSGATPDDAAGLVFTLSGPNRGQAALVDETVAEALLS